MILPTTGRRCLMSMLVVFAAVLPLNDSFLVGSSTRLPFLPAVRSFSTFPATEGRHRGPLPTFDLRATPNENETPKDGTVDSDQCKILSRMFRIAKIASALAWTTTAYVALSYHPDPRFKDCTLRHNLLTMSQAYAFPLPILWATFDALRVSAKQNRMESPAARHLGLASSVASFWLAASMAFAPRFAFGYDLYGFPQKVAAATVHAVTGLLTITVLLRSSTPKQIFQEMFDSLWRLGPKKSESKDSFEPNSSLLATGCVGLLWFTVLPIISPYPLATVPSILGKRLSRPASAFTLLASAMAFCLKEGIDSASTTGSTSRSAHRLKYIDDIRRILNRGLAIGSVTHLLLIALKLIGVDGGGLILPGRGLWEVYPAMISVPFAAGASMVIHAVIFLATRS